MSTESPLVSFLMFSYNQEQYIAQAVEAAFAQTYSNLEILISDDCSSDGTFGLIQAMVAAYSGPHKVACIRNPENIGIARHVNKLNKLANGELIVVAACDDISCPNRTQDIVDAYMSSQRSIHYFYSQALEIDLNGRAGKVVTSSGGKNAGSALQSALSPYPLAIGATQAWTKVLVNSFPPIHRRVWAEDQILGFRGVLSGGVRFIEKPLVQYRVGSGVSTTKRPFSVKRYYAGKVCEIDIMRQRTRDALHMKQYPIAAAISFKISLLTLALPLSPLISLVRKLVKKKQP